MSLGHQDPNHWMSLSTSWTFPETCVTVPRPAAPSITQRCTQKMSGLFDTGFTGEAGFSSVGNQAGFEDLKALNASDILTVLEKGEDLPDLNSTLEEDNFLEVFTDLSDYLFNGDVDDLTVTPDETKFENVVPVAVSPLALAADSKKAVKRTASEAFTPVNTDHDDYILKQPRLSTSSIEEAEVASTSSNDSKYLERRRKNNIASRRSRETRKQKFRGMEEQVIDLEAKNDELRQKVAELEKLTKSMKDILVKRLVNGQ